jgi:hypothetical protein
VDWARVMIVGRAGGGAGEDEAGVGVAAGVTGGDGVQASTASTIAAKKVRFTKVMVVHYVASGSRQRDPRD